MIFLDNTPRVEEVRRFAEQPPPRTIPRNIWLEVVAGSGFFYIWGAIFLLAGILLAVIALANKKGTISLVGALPAGIGFMAIFFTWLYRSRRWRLLREGRLCQAWVRDIRETPFVANNQRCYRVTLQYECDGQMHCKDVTVVEMAVSRAQELRDRQESSALLVDRDNPQKVLWLGGLGVE
ncbi:MAG: hypothetical protein KatS3mg110_2763 [Pirellulaceae bacterium]|nr:MAG: hypothetical protein KatS3mg110_2763 [Pirellulaceae bacterium]